MRIYKEGHTQGGSNYKKVVQYFADTFLKIDLKVSQFVPEI